MAESAKSFENYGVSKRPRIRLFAASETGASESVPIHSAGKVMHAD
jgi:hypothetical protein